MQKIGVILYFFLLFQLKVVSNCLHVFSIDPMLNLWQVRCRQGQHARSVIQGVSTVC